MAVEHLTVDPQHVVACSHSPSRASPAAIRTDPPSEIRRPTAGAAERSLQTISMGAAAGGQGPRKRRLQSEPEPELKHCVGSASSVLKDWFETAKTKAS